MNDQTPATRRSLARKGAVAAGLAGGMTALGFVAFGPGAATASPSSAPQAHPATAPAPAAAKQPAARKAVLAQKAAIAASPVPKTAEDKAFDAYFGAGYDYDDAVVLAKMWNISEPGAAKVAAGKKLEAGETLPIAPGSAPAAPADAGDSAVNAYFDAGYTYDDAVTLAQMWHLATPYDAKVAAGKKLAAGETLPIQP